MTYLITGATGFLGRKLIKALLARGDSVNYLARQRNPTMNSRAAYQCWDMRENAPLKVVPRLDAIVNLMGEPIAQRWTKEVKERIYSSRIEGTRKLVSALADLSYRPEVLVSASAVGYYGDRGDEVLTEESPAGSGFLAKTCADWEREARRAEVFGVRVVSIRVATVLGRDGGALPSMLKPFKLGLGGKFGDGNQWMSWVHVDDLVRLFVFAAENGGANGVLNGGSPNPVTNAEFTRLFARGVHRPAFLPMPKFALKLALGEMSSFLFDSLRVMPQKTAESGFRFDYPELNGALKNLV